MKDNSYIEKKCARCGRPFIVHDPSEYVFRRYVSGADKFFCSWSCLRMWDALRGTKADRRGRIQQAIRDGLSTNEICDLVGADKTTVLYWRKKMEEEQDHETAMA